MRSFDGRHPTVAYQVQCYTYVAKALTVVNTAMPIPRSPSDVTSAWLSAVLSAGLRTADIQAAGSAVVSTSQMGDAIIAELAKG